MQFHLLFNHVKYVPLFDSILFFVNTNTRFDISTTVKCHNLDFISSLSDVKVIKIVFICIVSRFERSDDCRNWKIQPSFTRLSKIFPFFYHSAPLT